MTPEITPALTPAALDYASAAIFALTGALAASRAQLDIIGFFFLACLTAGGGAVGVFYRASSGKQAPGVDLA